jgi:hypothetical protein
MIVKCSTVGLTGSPDSGQMRERPTPNMPCSKPSMLVKLRYVERRIDRSGGERWYWHRRGHKLVRLPDELAERVALAQQLNATADAANKAAVLIESARGSIGWVIQRYVASDHFAELTPGTVRHYRRFLRDIELLGPALPFASFTRRAVVDFIESYGSPHQRHQATAVLKNLFGIARYHGIVNTDEAAGLRVRTTKPRDRIWSDDEVARWLNAAVGEDPHMTTAFLLLQYSAQRPSDVLKTTWPQYSGSAIRLRSYRRILVTA